MRISDIKKGNLTKFTIVILPEVTGGKVMGAFFFQGRVLLKAGVWFHDRTAAREYAAGGGVKGTGGVSR